MLNGPTRTISAISEEAHLLQIGNDTVPDLGLASAPLPIALAIELTGIRLFGEFGQTLGICRFDLSSLLVDFGEGVEVCGGSLQSTL